jgi:hypothetical protein
MPVVCQTVRVHLGPATRFKDEGREQTLASNTQNHIGVSDLSVIYNVRKCDIPKTFKFTIRCSFHGLMPRKKVHQSVPNMQHQITTPQHYPFTLYTAQLPQELLQRDGQTETAKNIS